MATKVSTFTVRRRCRVNELTPLTVASYEWGLHLEFPYLVIQEVFSLCNYESHNSKIGLIFSESFIETISAKPHMSEWCKDAS